MPQKQRKSRDKVTGAIPEDDGVGGEGKARSEGGGKRKRHVVAGLVSDPEMVGKSDPERKLNAAAEITEKTKKKKTKEKESVGDDGKGKMEGNKDGEVRKGGSKAVERREDVDGVEGKLEDEVNNNKKKKKREGTDDEKARRKKKEDSEKGDGGVEMKGREDVTKEDESGKKSKEIRGSKNGEEHRSTAISLSSEGRKVEEDEVRKSSKQQRERKDKDIEKDEGDTDDVKKKPMEESGLSRKQKQRNGDEIVDEKLNNGGKSNGTVSQLDPPIVISLSRSMQKSRKDSQTKKNKEKDDGNGMKPSELKSQSKKRKNSEGEIKAVMVPTSSSKEELEEAANKAGRGKANGSSRFKNIRMSREKADEKDPKSCPLSLNRVRTIMRSHISMSRFTQESYFLICKATECFINQFCEDTFELAASHGLSKVMKYEHLSSLVYNMDRYDFLSDYVPQKKKAKDALAEDKLEM